MSVCIDLVLPKLSSLNLRTCAGMQTLASRLAQLSGLTALQLSANAIGDAATGAVALAHVLARLPKLADLRLARNALVDTDIEALAPAISGRVALTRLGLAANAVSATGWWHLVTHALPPTLMHLDMSDNDPCGSGRATAPAAATATSEAAKAMLARCTALTCLRWSAATEAAQEPVDLFERLPHLVRLGCLQWHGELFPTSLQHLELRRDRRTPFRDGEVPAFAAALAKLAPLEALALFDTHFDALSQALPITQAIAGLRALTSLQLRWSGRLEEPESFGERTFGALCACTQLRELSIDLRLIHAELEDLDPSLSRALQCWQQLRTLELSLYRESTYAVACAAQHGPCCMRRLALQGCFAWPDGPAALSRLTALTSLHISTLSAEDVHTHSAGQLAGLLQEVTALQALERLEVRLQIKDMSNLHTFLACAASLPCLRFLLLCSSVDGAVATVAGYLTRLTQLHGLHLGCSHWPAPVVLQQPISAAAYDRSPQQQQQYAEGHNHAVWRKLMGSLAPMTALQVLTLTCGDGVHAASMHYSQAQHLAAQHPRLRVLGADVTDVPHEAVFEFELERDNSAHGLHFF